ncbi:MAG TPA: hypothetical protein VG028_07850 [Terriglobia bacterium]|nr:hypothetical protein [Terriglobia bacterium]
MGSPETPAKTDAPGAAGRRSTRLNISVPIVISGKDTYGQPFRENSRATVMNLHGAKILTFHHLALGSVLTIENRALAITAPATVVWLGERKFPKDLGEAGIQLAEPGNIWGVDVPPEDWVEGACGSEVASSPEDLAALTAQRKAETDAKAGGAVSAEEGHLTSDQIGATLDVALDKFSKRVQDAADMQAALFEARVVKLTSQIGSRTQMNAEAAAAGAEEKMGQSLEKHLGTLTDRMESTRAEAEGLLARLQELQQSLQAEVEKARQSIQEASGQAVQTTTQELGERLRKESDATAAHFVEETRKRLQDESAAAIGALTSDAHSRLPKITADFFAQSEPEIQARQRQAVEQAANLVNQAAQSTSASAMDRLQKQSEVLMKDFEAHLEKAVHHARTKSAKDISEHIHTTATGVSEELLASSAKEFHKQAGEFKVAIGEDIKATVKTQAEEARKRLTALTHSTVESLNKEGNAGLDEFRKHLHKTLKDVQDKEGQNLEKHLEAAGLKYREHMQQELQKDTSAATERAVAHFRGKMEESGKISVESAQNQISDTVRKNADVLVENLRGELEKEAATFQEKTLAEIHAKLQSIVDQQVVDGVAQMSKQAERNLATVSIQMNEKKMQMVNEAEEAFRAKLAEVFASMLQPGARKAT